MEEVPIGNEGSREAESDGVSGSIHIVPCLLANLQQLLLDEQLEW